jgi:hypothetical protein
MLYQKELKPLVVMISGIGHKLFITEKINFKICKVIQMFMKNKEEFLFFTWDWSPFYNKDGSSFQWNFQPPASMAMSSYMTLEVSKVEGIYISWVDQEVIDVKFVDYMCLLLKGSNLNA